jgi:6-pyruvoyltetrahydropterin/6-carboxytetrahydropterin synthase
MDFRLLKAKTHAILETLDHKYLNELPTFNGKNPSSENLAAYIFAELSRQVDQEFQRVSWVSVWESQTSQATYRRPAR